MLLLLLILDLLQLLAEHLHGLFSVLEWVPFQSVRQRQLGRQQNILFGHRFAAHQRGMRARAAQDHQIGAMAIDTQRCDQRGNGRQDRAAYA